MTTPAPTREVVCYHCLTPLAVPGAARSLTCPNCYKGLVLDDFHVKDSAWCGRLLTCGRVFIDRRARTITRSVQAGDGVEVYGTLEARVMSQGHVLVARGGTLRGEVRAASLTVEPGAVVEHVPMHIGPGA